MPTTLTPSALPLHASAIVEAAQASHPDLPIALYLTGAKGAVLANTLRSLQRLGRKPRFMPQSSTVILAVVSGSRGDAHEIRIGKDGNVYCTCKAWRFQKLPAVARTCKHINQQFGIA